MTVGTQCSKSVTAHGKQITHQYQRQQKAIAQPWASFWFLITISPAPLIPHVRACLQRWWGKSATHLRTHLSMWLGVFSCPWTLQAWGKFNSTDVMWKESKLPFPQIATGYRLSRKLAHSSVWADNTPSHSSCASYALCRAHDRCLCSYPSLPMSELSSSDVAFRLLYAVLPLICCTWVGNWVKCSCLPVISS